MTSRNLFYGVADSSSARGPLSPVAPTEIMASQGIGATSSSPLPLSAAHKAQPTVTTAPIIATQRRDPKPSVSTAAPSLTKLERQNPSDTRPATSPWTNHGPSTKDAGDGKEEKTQLSSKPKKTVRKLPRSEALSDRLLHTKALAEEQDIRLDVKRDLEQQRLEEETDYDLYSRASVARDYDIDKQSTHRRVYSKNDVRHPQYTDKSSREEKSSSNSRSNASNGDAEDANVTAAGATPDDSTKVDSVIGQMTTYRRPDPKKQPPQQPGQTQNHHRFGPDIIRVCDENTSINPVAPTIIALTTSAFALVCRKIPFFRGPVFVPLVLGAVATGVAFGLRYLTAKTHRSRKWVKFYANIAERDPDYAFEYDDLETDVAKVHVDPTWMAKLSQAETLWCYYHEALQDMALFFRLVQQRTVGYAIRRRVQYHPRRTVDPRQTCHLEGTVYDHLIILESHDIINTFSCECTASVSSPEIVGQVLNKILPLAVKDRELQAFPHATRVTNQRVDSAVFPELARGSAMIAIIKASNATTANHHLKRLLTPRGVQKAPSVDYSLPVLLGLSAVASLSYLWLVRPRLFYPGAAIPMPAGYPNNIYVRLYFGAVVAPLNEEALKHLMAYLSGCGKPAAATAFGIGEWASRGFAPEGTLACLMHSFTGRFGFTGGLAVHSAFNAVVLSYNEYRNPGSPNLTGSTVTQRLLDTTFSVENIALAWFLLGRPLSARVLMEERPPIKYGYGYRRGEVVLPEEPVFVKKPEKFLAPGAVLCRKLKETHSAKVKLFANYHALQDRKVQQMVIGPSLCGLAPPMPDVGHGPTVLHGSLARFCSNPPPHDKTLLAELKQFTQKLVVKHFTPIPADADVSQETWVANTNNYPAWRKKQLLDLWDKNERMCLRRHRRVGLFAKLENYLLYKHARAINARDDMFKLAVGPFFKLMETEVYQHPSFIKHIPVHMRPGYIIDLLGSSAGPYYETDYTKFERHFTPEIMDALEMVLYKHMLKNFPEAYELIEATMTGKNVCGARSFVITVLGKRMSGEMCTSLGNGFSNFALAHFVAFKSGATLTGVFEGDDGLCATSKRLDEDIFLRCGFTIKIKVHDNILHSSFCGLVMSEDLITMTDPRKVLINFGWSHSFLVKSSDRVRKELLRAKALSLAYEHPQCPILSVLATRVLEYTKGSKPRFDQNYWKSNLELWVEQFAAETAEKLALGPSEQARMEFAELFGISKRLQTRIEHSLSEWDGGEITDPVILSLFDEKFEACRDYYERFCSYSPIPPC